jgi:2-polyprenyl-3-methyl-5-hydroxy-6-metoxy-1,4-benzoquinol methylase
MAVGPLIRRLFGPYERTVAEAYRSIFVDLDAFATLMHGWVPHAQNILEVGCGEGAMTERIAAIYPAAALTAIDITPKVGRLFRGPAANVTFCKETVEAVAARKPASYDLIILADVMHHVPPGARGSLMNAIGQALTPNGSLIFKDWIISSTPIYWLCLMSDRYLTGDNVIYFTPESIGSFVADTFGPGTVHETSTVPPWRNNVAVLVRRGEQ